jgi:hypothetical protein
VLVTECACNRLDLIVPVSSWSTVHVASFVCQFLGAMPGRTVLVPLYMYIKHMNTIVVASVAFSAPTVTSRRGGGEVPDPEAGGGGDGSHEE